MDDHTTVILSDTHIGRPGHGAGSAAALRPLWQGATRLVFNGDIAEVHDPTWRVRAAREVLQIQEWCEEDGVELIMLSGNHDPMLSDRRFLSLYGGRVFITHGDILHPAISPWNSYAPELQQMNELALSVIEPSQRQSLRSRLEAVQHVAHQDWDHEATAPRAKPSRWVRAAMLPFKVGRVFWYWATMHWRAYAFMRQFVPDAKFFVFGHYHHSGVWRMGRRVIINTGSYSFPAQPLAVVIHGDSVQVKTVRRNGDTFQLGSKDRNRFKLAG